MSATAWIGLAACLVALGPSGARWLRVAQREHYLAGSSSRFAVRWWFLSWDNKVLAILALAATVLSFYWPLVAVVPAAVALIGPRRLGLRGRTSKLAWTRRLKVLAGVWLILQAIVVVIGVVLGVGAAVAAIGVVLVPVLIDLACALLAPIEGRLAATFVTTATERLQRVHPTVVGITGSYGKTSTKNHLTHLVTGSRLVVASPASFNNRAGLARAINEHLIDGTEVFVAEMGTYGKGEIAALCAWCPPDIAVLTAIGPVHLERFKTEERIVEAKAEITVTASVVVLNVDDPRLARLADRLEGESPEKSFVRCSALDPNADVFVKRDDDHVWMSLSGRVVAEAAPLAGSAQATNLACAVAVALKLGVSEAVIVDRLGTMPGVPNRLTSAVAASGVLVFDDTFNANPAGARAALAALEAAPISGRRVLVTPGMIELGPRQRQENVAFATSASLVCSELLVVGRTNRAALRQGASPDVMTVLVDRRDDAVAWVRGHLGPNDAVLYENDLPDQYP
jgi:UDP-N-acetylmuramoyl-tripeptide--D-alanyl-D-alanine ligase